MKGLNRGMVSLMGPPREGPVSLVPASEFLLFGFRFEGAFFLIAGLSSSIVYPNIVKVQGDAFSLVEDQEITSPSGSTVLSFAKSVCGWFGM